MTVLSVSRSSKGNEKLQTFMKHSEYRMHLDFNCLQIYYLLYLNLFLPIVFVEYFQKIFHILTLLISELKLTGRNFHVYIKEELHATDTS